MHPNEPITTPETTPAVEPVNPVIDSKASTSNQSPITQVAEEKSVNSEVSTETPDAPEEPESPEWFMKDKYKSIEDQAKSAFELQKKMGKFWGSPQEGYKVDEASGITDNDPLIAGLTPALKEMGISQDGFNHLVSQYMDANKQMLKVLEEDLKKTLTTTDAHTYQAITKWMDDSLTPEESAQIKNNWLMTAEDFHLFNNLRLMLAPSTSVPSAQTTSVKYESSKEVTNDKIKYKTELKEGKRVKDKNYEDQLAGRFRDAAAREQRNKAR